jgi:hypothetical protein
MKKEIEIAINGNYTRGPWEVEYGQLHPSSEKEAYTIRTDAFDVVSGHLLIRREADALLIAAAPDLADALRESQAREKRLEDRYNRAMHHLSMVVNQTDGPGDYSTAVKMVSQWKAALAETEEQSDD